MQRVVICVGLILLFFFPASMVAQLRVEIEQVPDFTPAGDSLFLTGSFNEWSPADERFLFVNDGAGRYHYTFLTALPDFEYKVTRGDWASVEGGLFGEPIINRTYRHTGAVRDTVRIRINSWEDLQDSIAYFDTLRIRVTDIPNNTPVDATLYVVGNFNGWSPRDEDYRMQKTEDGNFVVTIPLRSDTTEFKITRGSWTAIESRGNGLAIPNHQHLRRKNPDREEVVLQIANWEDLAGNQLSWYAIFSLLTALQGLLLLVAINSFPARDRRARKLLSAIILLTALALAVRVAGFDRDVFQRWPKLILLPDLLYFVLPPLLLFYLWSFRSHSSQSANGIWPHFLPSALGLMACTSLLFMDNYGFITKVVSGDLKTHFLVVSLLGWLCSLGYWWWGRQELRLQQQRPDLLVGGPIATGYLKSVFRILSLVIISWTFIYVIGGIGYWLQKDWTQLTNNWTDATWLLLATLIYVIGYHVIRRPRIFRAVNEKTKFTPGTVIGQTLTATKQEPIKVENEKDLGPATAALTKLMKTHKPYLNPGLSLGELAELAGTSSHHLSKLINDGFEKNYFDFVNAYRVEEFIEQLKNGAHENRTMLSLAMEVGFNSKTAFNRAFKKHTGMTPRAYLKQMGGT